jgi:predicted CXXCH cytochrome family protein
MGRSMAPVVAARAPPDGAVDHPASGRRYEIYRKDGRLHHRELLRSSDKEPVVLSDFPVTYVVGSGRHALTYLAEADGFLIESPVTWYASRKKWGMSPGYDKPDQLGFERPITDGCLMCHAGRAEAVEGSLQRFRFHEDAIGCERCHGPGSLHLERQNRAAKADGGSDDTIVNPKRLPRTLADAVCEQCHLQSVGMVPVRGRRFEDFRPGLPLEEFRFDYEIRRPGAAMTVTGHVEQMHQSLCYQKSETLSCLTCHDPHAFPKPAERVAYYRAICQNCHEHRKPCTNPAAQDAKNGCVKCHMPTGDTDIPHLAFTHHRIGLHTGAPAAVPDPRAPSLIQPFEDLARFSELDRDRSLSLAYLQLASVQRDARTRDLFRRRGVELLDRVEAEGLQDPLVDSMRCRLSYGRQPDEVVFRAQKALAHPELPPLDRCDTMYILADAYFRQRQYPEAVAVLKNLNRLRRHLPYWLLLANCYEALGEPAAEARALEQAATINPTLAEVRQRLSAYYEQKGERDRAAYHRRRIVAN